MELINKLYNTMYSAFILLTFYVNVPIYFNGSQYSAAYAGHHMNVLCPARHVDVSYVFSVACLHFKVSSQIKRFLCSLFQCLF